MKRLWTQALVFFFCLGIGAVLLGAATRYLTEESGEGPYAFLDDVVRQLDSPFPEDDRPLVTWIGDSTLMPVGHATYPQLLEQRTGEQIRHQVLAFEGADAFFYYHLLDRVLARDPDLVILIAHLRMFLPQHVDPRLGALTSLIPESQLARSLLLPWSARSLTIPRLLLDRALAGDALRGTAASFEAPRRAFQEAGFWTRLGSERPARNTPWFVRRVLREYVRPLSPRNPVVRMLAEDVATIQRHRSQALVLVAPVNWQALTELGIYDATTVRESIQTLREVTEANGGTLLDLHDLLSEAFFRDRAGHYHPAGDELIAARLTPELMKELKMRLGPKHRQR